MTVDDWNEVLPHAAPFALRVIKEGGYTLRPHTDIPESDRPNYDLNDEENAVVTREALKCLKWGVLHSRSSKPRCVSASGCVDKKTRDDLGELEKRIVFDAEVPNERLSIWKQRFEGIKYICAIAQKGWVVATLDVKKGYWTISCLSTTVLGVRVRLRRKWVLEAVSLAAARLRDSPDCNATVSLDDVTPEDWNKVDLSEDEQCHGDWQDYFAVYTVLPMGLRPSGAVFVTMMRQFVARWRSDDWAIIYHLSYTG